MTGHGSDRLPPWDRVLVVVAHPDDESFGMGAVIDAFTDAGAAVSVLCLTHGEASTLGAVPELAKVRSAELAEAARQLGVDSTQLLGHPDGGLAALDRAVLERDIAGAVDVHRPDGILVMDPRHGVTGHPDHETASRAAWAVAAAHGIPVLGWALPVSVTLVLNAEYGASFTGYDDDDLDVRLTVDRARQMQAIAAHASQAVPSSVLWRRLELQGDQEFLRALHREHTETSDG